MRIAHQAGNAAVVIDAEKDVPTLQIRESGNLLRNLLRVHVVAFEFDTGAFPVSNDLLKFSDQHLAFRTRT